MTLIPSELLTLFGSSIIGSLMRIWGCNAQTRRLERLFYLEKAKLIQHARVFDNKGFQWTRCCIALFAVFFIVVFPKLISVLFPEIDIHLGYPQSPSGLLSFFIDGEKIKWVQLQGLVITPLDTHLVAAIIGLYFGGSLINSK